MMFSVIIPIYNVLPYLTQAIESVLFQSYKDFELILIDDGSCDGSGELCDGYASRYEGIIVIHKQNEGLSAARNTGIELAQGDYLVFIDGDDWMSTNSLEKLSDTITQSKPEMIIGAHYNVSGDSIFDYVGLDISPLNQIIDREHLYEEMVKSSRVYWSASSNIFKSSIVHDNNLRFTRGLTGAEDCQFFFEFVRHCQRIFLVSFPFFFYRRNRIGSITQIMAADAIEGQLKVYSDNFYMYFNEAKLRSFFSSKFANTIYLIKGLKNEDEILKITNIIMLNREILSYAKGLKYNFSKLIWRVFGLYRGSRILERIRGSHSC